MPDNIIDRCECGHLSIDHVRWVHSNYPCSSCPCRDHAPVIPDPETVSDILILLAT
jgi:hypothetical protein